MSFSPNKYCTSLICQLSNKDYIKIIIPIKIILYLIRPSYLIKPKQNYINYTDRPPQYL